MTNEFDTNQAVFCYGYCPECGAAGVERERRPNGNDKCENGHVYPSASAVHIPGGYGQ